MGEHIMKRLFICKWKKKQHNMLFLNRRMRLICIGFVFILASETHPASKPDLIIWRFWNKFHTCRHDSTGYGSIHSLYSHSTLLCTHNNCRIYHAGNSFTYPFFSFFFFISTMYPSNSSTMYTIKRNCGAVGAVLPLPLPLPVVIATSTINRISWVIFI